LESVWSKIVLFWNYILHNPSFKIYWLEGPKCPLEISEKNFPPLEDHRWFLYYYPPWAIRG
jgi:hypothetical protein